VRDGNAYILRLTIVELFIIILIRLLRIVNFDY